MEIVLASDGIACHRLTAPRAEASQPVAMTSPRCHRSFEHYDCRFPPMTNCPERRAATLDEIGLNVDPPAPLDLKIQSGRWSSSDPIEFHFEAGFGELVGLEAGFKPHRLRNQRARAGMSGSAHFESGGKSGISISESEDPVDENSAAAIKS